MINFPPVRTYSENIIQTYSLPTIKVYTTYLWVHLEPWDQLRHSEGLRAQRDVYWQQFTVVVVGEDEGNGKFQSFLVGSTGDSLVRVLLCLWYIYFYFLIQKVKTFTFECTKIVHFWTETYSIIIFSNVVQFSDKQIIEIL